jgi:hypothetical protein
MAGFNRTVANQRRLSWSLSRVVLLAAAALVCAVAMPPHTHAKERSKGCGAKCRKAGATAFLAGHRYSFGTYNGASGQSIDVDLCAEGSSHTDRTFYPYRNPPYGDSFDGTWKVTSAKRRSARIAYTTFNYSSTSSVGFGPPLPPPQAGVAVLLLKPRIGKVVLRAPDSPTMDSLWRFTRMLLPIGACPVAGSASAG